MLNTVFSTRVQVYPDALRIDEQLVDHCSLKGNQFVSGAVAGVQVGSLTTARVGEGHGLREIALEERGTTEDLFGINDRGTRQAACIRESSTSTICTTALSKVRGNQWMGKKRQQRKVQYVVLYSSVQTPREFNQCRTGNMMTCPLPEARRGEAGGLRSTVLVLQNRA